MRVNSLILFLFISTCLSSQSAEEIIVRSDEVLRGSTAIADMTITIVRPRWERTMRLKSWTKDKDYSLIYLKSPKKDEGTTFLRREKEMWNYIPRIERTIKLPPSMMMQSWMGTDFSNDDLVKQSSIIEDFTHLLDGDSIILNRRCWKLILTAKEEAAVVWGKMEIWIDQKDYLQLCTNFYDEDGYLINVMQVKEIQKMGGRVIPKIMEMYPADEKDKKTIMSYNSIVFDAQLPVNIFSLNQIKQLRD